MSQMSQLSHRVSGNTKTETRALPHRVRHRSWVFTLNNPTISLKDIATCLESHDIKYIIGDETAPTTGTRHFQGYIASKNQISLSTLQEMIPLSHFEKARGTPEQNYNYCCKSGTFLSNITLKQTNEEFTKNLHKTIINKEYDQVQWKPWQQEILDLLSSEPDTRTIHWYWEPTGNTGKSYLAKYISITMEAIIAEGKKTDIFHQLKLYMDLHKVPKIIITDIARSDYDDHIYPVLEKLKNGHIFSGKFDGGVCTFPHPHVVVFSNHCPDTSLMSADRWHIVQIQ